jgi:hypothetical protein
VLSNGPCASGVTRWIAADNRSFPQPFFNFPTRLILLLFSFLQLFLCRLSFHHLIGPLAGFLEIVGFRSARFPW